ncbi:hypothetical protein HD554DRAFT_2029994 [Boletus coccyginus]|nr:hypothetical protein HD554DRAFT_2029994 [Boletus coccyginus]
MEIHKFISDILEGKARVISFDNVAFGPDKDTTAAVLSALNFARLAFAAEGSTPVLSKILALLCTGDMVDDAIAVCSEWPGGVTHLEVEEVYHIPLFEASLKLVSTDYDSPSPEHIARLLENLRSSGSSAAVLLTRDPDVVTCLRLRAPTQDVFVLFNPRVTSERAQVASLTFSTSIPHITQRLCDVFPLDKAHPTQGNLDWQAELLEKCTGHVFLPRDTSYDAGAGEESLIVSSLTLLALRAELEELTQDNGSLRRENKGLEKSIVDLEAQLEEEKTKSKRTQATKPSVVNTTHGSSAGLGFSPRLTHYSGGKGRFDIEDEMDPSTKLALQLQATFDSENDFLLNQKRELTRTAQRQYHCGVCLDDVPEDDVVRIDACRHELCRDCARGHVCTKIEEHRFPVLCPVCMADHKNQNPGTIPGTLVQLLGVSEEQWAIWAEMEIAQFSIPINCRKCHHSGFIDRLDLEAISEIHCPFPACDHVWCKTCQQTIESGGPKHSCDGTAELDHLVKQQGWRYCPSCKTPIQKLQGCNHLSCIAPGCNTHFCYGCGETINRTAIPGEISQGKTAHFRSCSLF